MIRFGIFFKVSAVSLSVVCGVLLHSSNGWPQDDRPERLETVVQKIGPSQGSVSVPPELGSAFVIQDKGLIGTNFHVLGNMCNGKFEIGSDGQDSSYSLNSIFHFRSDADIAIVRVQGVDLPPVKLGSSKPLKVGSTVSTIGSPQGLRNTPGEGKIAGFRTTDQLKKWADINAKFKQIVQYFGNGIRLIQHNIPITDGSSGSPLLDANLEVVGVNFASLSGNNNLAIPIELVKQLLDRPDLKFPTSVFCKIATTVLPIAYWDPPKNVDIKTGTPVQDKLGIYFFTAVDGSTFWGSDRNGDGIVDAWAFATGNDGNPDCFVYDEDFNKSPDRWKYDINHDGKSGLVGYDRFSKGPVRIDQNKRDGIPDTWTYVGADEKILA